ncbi:MAG: hypothetical protein COV91_00095 [Candidatus Taylorbacteria bacterium CG11_big_fil_rev_8_21_14_0_20_46_11]|uniref:Uncharacterized protein n=1 Tax=Candidatus Taylorbacteria bacterium CG11_big_fil_rev_8_21_14_0_20_46_11 TaxID=1975025 RepID=A0A2H0KD97_9BACT|nr:MAG: hypothetical protein COV91_00095 [Candidatus Taylorbacteria bacterium CG11_big_fil_rev_8_21_14_0_20_46_11]
MQTVLEPLKQPPTERLASHKPHTDTPAPHGESPLELQIRIGAFPQPIDPDRVKSEKKRFLREARLACGAPWPLRYLWVRNVVVPTGGVCALVSYGCAFTSVIMAGISFFSTFATGIALTVIFSYIGIAVGLFVFACFMLGVVAMFNNYRIPSWERREYHDFVDWSHDEPVPKEVKDLADEIETRLPESYLFVDRLVHTKDPFLGVRYQGKDYFFLHWD